MDPRVLVVRAFAPGNGLASVIDLGGLRTHLVRAATGEHVRIAMGTATLRLDVVEGTLMGGPASIAPTVTLGTRLGYQIQAIRQLDALLAGRPIFCERDRRLAVLVGALRAADALSAGASLREIGLDLLGGDSWPGEGEHLKSRARRLVALARALTSAGPAGVLGHWV